VERRKFLKGFASLFAVPAVVEAANVNRPEGWVERIERSKPVIKTQTGSNRCIAIGYEPGRITQQGSNAISIGIYAGRSSDE